TGRPGGTPTASSHVLPCLGVNATLVPAPPLTPESCRSSSLRASSRLPLRARCGRVGASWIRVGSGLLPVVMKRGRILEENSPDAKWRASRGGSRAEIAPPAPAMSDSPPHFRNPGAQRGLVARPQAPQGG